MSVDPDGDAVLTMEDAILRTMRQPARKMLVRANKGSCPAFEYWADRLKSGERLPRGKYFKSCDYFRSFQSIKLKREYSDFSVCHIEQEK